MYDIVFIVWHILEKVKWRDEMIKKLEDALLYIPFLRVSGLCLVISFVGEYVVPFMNNGTSNQWMVNFAWVSIVLSGTPLLVTAIKRLMIGWISSPLLISIAMLAAIYIGDIFAAGEVAFIMAIGAYIEELTVERTKRGMKDLIGLIPTMGRRIKKIEHGNWELEEVAVSDLKKGDIIRVLPGEIFATDGNILAGETSVDQSIMTGEFLPVDKGVGDEVHSGTMNQYGSVDVEVVKKFEDSSLQKMVRLVKEAEGKKAPMEVMADRWSRYLVPIALLIAMGAYVFMVGGIGHEDALNRAVTILVVFCPCALVLATPTSVMAAIGQATKRGVLIKSGEALERMGKVCTIAFDKTGTLTYGNLVVTDIVTYKQMREEELLSLVGSIESRSEHPIGKAILQKAKENQVPIVEVEDFRMIVGQGVIGAIEKRKIMCGNEKLIYLSSNEVLPSDVNEKIIILRAQGKVVMIVADEKEILGLVALADEMKETANQAMEELKEAGISQSVLLTGDNEKTANYVASKIGITKVRASLLPENKVEEIQKLVKEEKHICMVGDGVNDAPALKMASVGIAMGSMGSDIAIEAADIAIMGDDISKIAYIKKLSNQMVSSIKFNITLSLIINAIAIALSVSGRLTPTTGALVHNLGSIFVVLNAGRLYYKKI